MKAIGLRLFLTPDVLANLVSAVADKFKHFVRIKNTRHAGQAYEVDLTILDTYYTGPLNIVDPKNRVAVTREMVGEFFDILGIFPRTEKAVIPQEDEGVSGAYLASEAGIHKQ